MSKQNLEKDRSLARGMKSEDGFELIGSGWTMFTMLLLVRTGWWGTLLLALTTVAFAVFVKRTNVGSESQSKIKWYFVYGFCGIVFWTQSPSKPTATSTLAVPSPLGAGVDGGEESERKLKEVRAEANSRYEQTLQSQVDQLNRQLTEARTVNSTVSQQSQVAEQPQPVIAQQSQMAEQPQPQVAAKPAPVAMDPNSKEAAERKLKTFKALFGKISEFVLQYQPSKKTRERFSDEISILTDEFLNVPFNGGKNIDITYKILQLYDFQCSMQKNQSLLEPIRSHMKNIRTQYDER